MVTSKNVYNYIKYFKMTRCLNVELFGIVKLPAPLHFPGPPDGAFYVAGFTCIFFKNHV